MAVVQSKPSRRQQRQWAIEYTIGTIVGVIMVGVVGPIILAIVIGEIWRH
jgi:hypothetical protein